MLGLAVAVGGGFLATELREREDAERLATQAQHLLCAPLDRAPELAQLQAARAVDLLENAIDLHDAPRARGLLAWAEALAQFQKGKLDRARQRLADARQLLPDRADLDVLAAALALQAGDRDAAAAHVQAALAREPTHTRARILAADLEADAGRNRRALALLAKLVHEQPDAGTLYNRRGLAREALGETSAAMADFERAAALDPRLSQPHLNLGRLLRVEGRLREAEHAFASAVQREPDEPEGWLGRGLTRIAQGDLAGGRLDLERAREIAPAEPAPLVALADADAQGGDLAQAVSRYRAALALAATDALALLKLGNALTRQRDFAGARTAFERAIELEPELSAAHNGLGAALMGAGDHERAENAFATAAALDRHDPNPLRNLALLYARRGDTRAARDARERALERDPSLKL